MNTKSYHKKNADYAIHTDLILCAIRVIRYSTKQTILYFRLPPMISSNSLVMLCWRVLLYCIVSS